MLKGKSKSKGKPTRPQSGKVVEAATAPLLSEVNLNQIDVEVLVREE